MTLSPKSKYLNIGCGSSYIAGWDNIDLNFTDEHVFKVDVCFGLPYKNDAFEVVYHSHVLEHFSKCDGESFLTECLRVLKPGGIIRVVVPDLEYSVSGYLTSLKNVRANPNEMNQANYEWSVLELIDQMVRMRSGGMMMDYWKSESLINEQYILDRIGSEFEHWRRDYLLRQNSTLNHVEKKKTILKRSKERLRKLIKPHPKLLSVEFENSGEKHKWMYDSHSLRKTLTDAGYVSVSQHSAFESSIDNWQEFMVLDVLDGKVRKPDSLFMEARKAK